MSRLTVDADDAEAMGESLTARYINDLMAHVESLIETAKHMPIFGAEASVKNMRKAAKYIGAVESAQATVAAIRRSLYDPS